jgi:hypothetical protein
MTLMLIAGAFDVGAFLCAGLCLATLRREQAHWDLTRWR